MIIGVRQILEKFSPIAKLAAVLKTAMLPEANQSQQQRLTEQKELFCQLNTKQLFLIDAWFQQCHRERTVVYFVVCTTCTQRNWRKDEGKKDRC